MPCASNSATDASRFSGLRPVVTTPTSPDASRPAAVAWPMPRLPPVTTATLPSTRISTIHLPSTYRLVGPRLLAGSFDAAVLHAGVVNGRRTLVGVVEPATHQFPDEERMRSEIDRPPNDAFHPRDRLLEDGDTRRSLPHRATVQGQALPCGWLAELHEHFGVFRRPQVDGEGSPVRDQAMRHGVVVDPHSDQDRLHR